MPVQPRLLNLSIYINDHLRDDLTLEVLAARMNLSPFHFHRKFRAYFGESLHQHIKRLRLERSAHALLYRLTPVSSVARVSGYKTLSAFSHAFSAHFGVAPTRFREVMLTGRLAERDTMLRERLGAAWVEQLAPATIVTLPERQVGFLRADLPSAEEIGRACAAAEQLRGQFGGDQEVIVASVDLFGLLTGEPVRLEVGAPIEANPSTYAASLGTLTLPAGRYAVFPFIGAATQLAWVLGAIYQFWVPRSGERTRATAHFVSTREPTIEPSGKWEVYVPLEEAPAGAAAGQS